MVLCSLPAIRDLLEKRSEIYSDRLFLPMHQMCAELRPASVVVRVSLPTGRHLVLCRMVVEWLLPISRHGEYWREGREIADRSLRPASVSLYHQRIEEQTRWFLSQLLASPADFRGHIEWSVVLLMEERNYDMSRSLPLPTQTLAQILPLDITGRHLKVFIVA